MSSTPGPSRASGQERRRVLETERTATPAEFFLTAQTLLLIVLSSWAGGGRLPWAPAAILSIAVLGLPGLRLRVNEGACVRGRAFIPLGLWLVLLGVAWANPSHAVNAAGAWEQRPDWITWLPTMVDRDAGLAAQLPWLAALLQGGVLVAAQLGCQAVRYIFWGAALNGFALAAVGAAFHFSLADSMLGFIDVPEPTYFFATFFYKNHWAAYGALAGIAGTTVALQAWRRALAGDPGARGQVFLFGATALLTLLTLPLPRSRAGGLLAVVITIGFFAVLLGSLMRVGGIAPARRAMVLAALGALLVATAFYGVKTHLARSGQDIDRTARQINVAQSGDSFDIRLLVSRDTWRMATARPWFGWGIGSFGIVFPAYQGNYLRRPDGKPAARFEFAHNDWLQMAAEAGLVGLAVLLVPAAQCGHRAWRDGQIGGRWAIAGCGVIALYAWADFPLNNPSVLALWTILVATAGRLGAEPDEA